MKKKENLNEDKIWEQLKGKIKYSQESNLIEENYLEEKVNSLLQGKKIVVTLINNSKKPAASI